MVSNNKSVSDKQIIKNLRKELKRKSEIIGEWRDFALCREDQTQRAMDKLRTLSCGLVDPEIPSTYSGEIKHRLTAGNFVCREALRSRIAKPWRIE